MIEDKKYRKLIVGVFLDAIGLVTSSWVLPLIGDFADVIWAPLSAWLMLRMYKGDVGKVAAAISFVEEIIPGIDVIPSFTLTWIYTYVLKKRLN